MSKLITTIKRSKIKFELFDDKVLITIMNSFNDTVLYLIEMSVTDFFFTTISLGNAYKDFQNKELLNLLDQKELEKLEDDQT